ncbi:DNA polymerase III subunit epsilon [Caulobacter sp. S45]|jgi:DNA polymerase-3 subunit epsilon|uniref:DNA polymerase III subunit epsilon n=1 Tax=Caulobacter sp. S45 TaxID=1641861 RepID=UPI00131EB1A7|nr:DNA polymerase III subunit epsilon [Caulobacter sp. S45]
MAREIVLDTETTGIDPRSGHRMIEIACIEIEDLLPTGAYFHRFIDPERDIEPEAEKVHGISRASLIGKPKFGEKVICEEFLDFVAGAQLVAHNAAFDRGFVNMELERVGRPALPEARWTCTYELAKKRFPGMYNSLDALCKRFKISLAEREKHGALIDTRLLSMVYLELQGGKERALDLGPSKAARAATVAAEAVGYPPRARPLAPLSTAAEREAHLKFVQGQLKDKAIWLQLGLEA